MQAKQYTFEKRGKYSLQDIFDVLASPRRFEDVLNRILDVSLRELQADQGSLLLVEHSDGPTLRMLASRGLPAEVARRGYVPRKASISEYVLREQRAMIVNGENWTENFNPLPDDIGVPREIRSALCVPLVARGHVLGTLNLNRMRRRKQFTEEDVEAATIIAGQAAIVIENKQLEEHLMQSERLAAIGQVVAGISHCMKNILFGVSGGISLTESGLEQKDEALMTEGFALLKRNSSVLSNIVLDLLDYCKERQPTRRRFNIAETLTEVVDSCEHKARVLGVTVECSLPPYLVYNGDRDQIFRASLNLAANAIEAVAEEFNGPSPVVRIEAGTTRLHGNEHLFITVSDNGPGIPEDAGSQIWELFYSTKGSKGTGLGLPATRKMVEEHGGRVEVQSEPGQGTRFRVLLPTSDRDPSMSSEQVES